ncbi:MAG: GGDEF domain-containing protein [Betaproteobacteria bacterium]|nr:GGDEF domain-containing protein [Betaproteobacteria bacterium]
MNDSQLPGWMRSLLLCLAIALHADTASALIEVREPTQKLLRTDVYVLDDRNRALDAEAAFNAWREGRFSASKDGSSDINFGYSASAFWVMLPLAWRGDREVEYLLEIGHPPLDRAELFVPRGREGENGAERGFVRMVAGDVLPFASRPFAHRNLVFPVALKPGEENLLLLRITSEGSLTLPLALWTPKALAAHDQKVYALVSLYYGILLALFLYNIMVWVAIRDPLYLVYVGCVMFMGIGQAALNGLGNQFLWPGVPAWGNVSLPVAMSASGLLGAQFVRMFLTTPRAFPRLDRALVTCIVSFALAIVCSAVIDYRVGAILTSLAGILFAVTAFGVGVYCQIKGHRTVRYLLLAWFVLLVGVAIQAMRNLGWVPTNLFTQYAMQAGSSLDLLLLSFALADRINLLRRDKEESDAALIASKQELVTALRKNEAELEARVAERTRDLQMANERLVEKERQLEYMARHDSLTGLANRSLLAIRMEHTLARARRSGRLAAVLLVDVDNFKQINDREGHLVGDQVLVKLASRFSDTVRMTDTVARYGGDEYVVVLEEAASEDVVRQVVRKLIDASAEPVMMPSGKSITATVSIGVALFPADGDNAEELLRKADNAMFGAKSAGRNRWLAAGPLGQPG